MQHLSISQAAGNFTGTTSLLDVRRAFKSTPWGSRYIKFLYVCKTLLVVLAVALCGPLSVQTAFGYLAAYFSLMFVREMVTLRDTLALARLPTSEVGPQ